MTKIRHLEDVEMSSETTSQEIATQVRKLRAAREMLACVSRQMLEYDDERLAGVPITWGVNKALLGVIITAGSTYLAIDTTNSSGF
jgi:hypothetical protein